MARGVRFPMRVNAHGGCSLTDEDRPQDSLYQVIAISVVPGGTTNPWDLVDGIAAPGANYRTGPGSLISFLERRFTRLRGRARLNGIPQVSPPNETGRREVRLHFTNLEVGEAGSYRREV